MRRHVDAIETARMAICLNAVVTGRAIDRFWGDGAQFVSGPGGHVVARDPIGWLATMQECQGFNVSLRWDERLPEFPIWFQPSRWVLKVHSNGTISAWRPSFKVQDAPDSVRRLWLVTYYPEDGDDAPVPKRELVDIADRLSEVLQGLITLTGERIPHWQPTFIGLLAILDGRAPPYAENQLPQDILGDLANRLFGTVSAANLFSGMGNWGDNSYDDDVHAEIGRLTADLFFLLIEAVISVVKTTWPGGNSGC